MNCFSHVFWHLSDQKKSYQRENNTLKKSYQRKSSTLKHAVVNNNKF